MNISTPSLILDENICKQNIEMMVSKAAEKRLLFRPHFKTHQSLAVGEWFREAGVEKITVSSIQMALYFANAGWNDITVAFPVNIREFETINQLAEKVTNLNLLFENIEAIRFLDERLVKEIGAFIKVDCGYHRAGIVHTSESFLEEVLEAIDKSRRLTFKGLLTHSGQTYKAGSFQEIEKIHKQSLEIMSGLRKKINRNDCIISIGDTPSCSLMNDFEGADEIRPGNFVFYDAMQSLIGSCESSDIAVAMACPVVAKHPERQEIIIYGGGVHLSKESLETNGQPFYGYVCLPNENRWSKPVENAFVSSLSQEHGIVKVPSFLFGKVDIGDLLYIIPVHSCLAAQCAGNYYLTDGTEVDHLIKQQI